jgi:hypothetical protein
LDRVDLLRAVERVAVLDLAGAIIANPERAMCSLADKLALAYATENFWAIALEAEVLARAVERGAGPEQLLAQAGRVNALMAEHRRETNTTKQENEDGSHS